MAPPSLPTIEGSLDVGSVDLENLTPKQITFMIVGISECHSTTVLRVKPTNPSLVRPCSQYSSSSSPLHPICYLEIVTPLLPPRRLRVEVRYVIRHHSASSSSTCTHHRRCLWKRIYRDVSHVIDQSIHQDDSSLK